MTDLRTRTRDLYTAAQEIRGQDIPDVEEQRERLVTRLREEATEDDTEPLDVADQSDHQRYRRLTEQLRELHGTADTYEHYADEWSADADACEFVLQELNGDEYAATLDAVSNQAAKQARQDGDLPDGYGQVKALEYGVEDIPDGAPADPGAWPAAIVTELFATLNEITAPEGVDLGNESLVEALSEDGDMAVQPGTPMEGEVLTPDGA